MLCAPQFESATWAPVPGSSGACVVVFDMGGVLYDFQGDRLIARTSRRARRWRSEEVQAHWAELARDFETGLATETEFAASVVQRYDLTLTQHEFLLEFRQAAVGFYDGALNLVAAVCQRYPVLSLSNTNPVQWTKVLSDLGATDPFQAHHPSHLSGFHKPDPRAYQRASTQFPAGTEFYFFDDRIENVHAAQSYGWHALRVRGVAETREACQRAGLL